MPLPTPATRCTVSRGAPSPDCSRGISSSPERFGSRSLHWARTPAGPFSGPPADHHAPRNPPQTPPPTQTVASRAVRAASGLLSLSLPPSQPAPALPIPLFPASLPTLEQTSKKSRPDSADIRLLLLLGTPISRLASTPARSMHPEWCRSSAVLLGDALAGKPTKKTPSTAAISDSTSDSQPRQHRETPARHS